MRAYTEWKEAGDIQNEFRDHPWTWTRTHGFFALMGGFVLQDGVERTALAHRYYSPDLYRLKTKEIMNPRITKKQISGRSKSDGLGNTILVLQLSWFILQVVARAANKLTITLLEVDTLALAILSIPLFFFWWSKPMAPESHHIFYTVSPHAAERTSSPDEELLLEDVLFSTFVTPRCEVFSPVTTIPDDDFIRRSEIEWRKEIFGQGTGQGNNIWVMSIVWVIFGGLHLLAWDFQFPSEAEKIIWRVASFALIAAPCFLFLTDKIHMASDNLGYGLVGVGVVARLLLLVLMLAGLRDLPATTYQTVSWTTYVPHL
ncbi:hypothetical protein PAXINDRAFT_172231 [Paxillus involutus ATCC 200175]|uniref:Unplaced genomic scaffold PAXINscaffold_92, whole genome shotgun sequence n=1 Tax=Paxillus involutus ATCC 200175 TaxID=664439 RepID=A0A0C9TSP9_PAXIN|nr:hypothetical protein PAXINDRAFT_172231 [Paxillus involutus ATCC 200175]